MNILPSVRSWQYSGERVSRHRRGRSCTYRRYLPGGPAPVKFWPVSCSYVSWVLSNFRELRAAAGQPMAGHERAASPAIAGSAQTTCQLQNNRELSKFYFFINLCYNISRKRKKNKISRNKNSQFIYNLFILCSHFYDIIYIVKKEKERKRYQYEQEH